MSSPHSDAALIVFAKAPVAGTVKTRLTSLLSPEDAASLYAAFLRDSLTDYAALPADVHLWIGGDEGDMPADVLARCDAVHGQRGADLGERMLAAFVDAFMSGYERAVIIGTDHPTLPLAFVEHAFAELAEPLRLVLGPSEDGGFYLMGMNDLHPTLFKGMTYSHGAVFDETLERAQPLQVGLTILPTWYDVDGPDALRTLMRDLDAGEDGAEHTRAVLARLRTTYDLT